MLSERELTSGSGEEGVRSGVELELLAEDAHEVLAIENGDEEDEGEEGEEVGREASLVVSEKGRGRRRC